MATINWDTVFTGVVTTVAVSAVAGTVALIRRVFTKDRLKRAMSRTVRSRAFWIFEDVVAYLSVPLSGLLVGDSPSKAIRFLGWFNILIILITRILLAYAMTVHAVLGVSDRVRYLSEKTARLVLLVAERVSPEVLASEPKGGPLELEPEPCDATAPRLLGGLLWAAYLTVSTIALVWTALYFALIRR
ncbi:MAG TPA: hypothetical protein VGI81_10565 [Tepidisphaeraceae bacterium]